jgi:hypothetical protein
MTKGLAVETLSHGSGIKIFFSFDNTMAEFMNVEHFAYVCFRGKVITNIGYLLMTACVTLSVP